MVRLLRRFARFVAPLVLIVPILNILALPAPAAAQGTVAVPSAGAPEPEAAADTEADALVDWLAAPWQGDLPGILERGFLRVGTAYNPVLFSYSGADQRGIVVDLTNELQAHLRNLIALAIVPIHVILFHLEDLDQQIGRALIVHLARQTDSGIVSANCTGFSFLIVRHHVLGGNADLHWIQF